MTEKGRRRLLGSVGVQCSNKQLISEAMLNKVAGNVKTRLGNVLLKTNVMGTQTTHDIISDMIGRLKVLTL